MASAIASSVTETRLQPLRGVDQERLAHHHPQGRGTLRRGLRSLGAGLGARGLGCRGLGCGGLGGLGRR